MLWKINKYTILIFALLFFVLAAILENGLLKKHPEAHLIFDFREKLLRNEAKLDALVEEVAVLLESDRFDGEVAGYHIPEGHLMASEGFAFLIYRNGELQYWSDRSTAFAGTLAALPAGNVVQLPNGYYLTRRRQAGEDLVVGLHLIKHNYTIENKYLKNTYFHAYKLPDAFEFSLEPDEEHYNVTGARGEFLFSVHPKGTYLCTTRQLYLPGIIYFIGLLILLLYFRREFIDSRAPFFMKLFALGTVLFLVYWLHLIFHIPKVFYLLRFFSPSVFALNTWLPSLGDFFLLALFLLFWCFHFGKHLNLSQLLTDPLLSRRTAGILLLLFSGSTYLLIQYYIEELIFNSTISFSLNRIIGISAQSVLAIFSAGLLLLAVIYLTVKIIEQIRSDFRPQHLLPATLLIVLFLAGTQYLATGHIAYEALALFFTTTLLAILLNTNFMQQFTLSYMILFVSAASFYSLIVFYTTIASKQRDEQKLMAVTLVNERDPAAELFLTEIQKEINVDGTINELVIEEDEEALLNYLDQTYFNSYFRQYDVRFTVCSGGDSIHIPMYNRTELCIEFFEEMIAVQGIHIPGTRFYFMDNMNGRISYTGWLDYPLRADRRGVSIFIEMNSAMLFEGIGFPELLIDRSMAKPENYKKYNYAKYYGGELTDKHGDYNYNFYVHTYLSSDKEFEYKRWDGMEHLIHHSREDNYVIVSRDPFTAVDYLISFPYLFVFYFITLLILLLIDNPAIRRRSAKVDLKFKIQAAIISIVFVSLLVVALATIFYNVQQYKTKHQNDLSEKMKSISTQMDQRLEEVQAWTPEVLEWLNWELGNLSNIFRTDINLYGTKGNLIASSRPEIFLRGFISERMNANAYHEIFNNFQISYFQREAIGGLTYLSAYKPVINSMGEYLGAVNLPYFIRQDRYSQELSTIIVAIINLYVLLFLVSIIVAIFIANQITRPLVLIQENLRKIELGKRNEPLHYGRDDEIGSLVREYNKKVDELAASAELLARSERESAWREMARQIAHEIKNPLTPMKLNIQHLQRMRGKGEAYDQLVKKVTGTLIEQIDNLSNIATEFSNFAKMPPARNQVFKLAAQINRVMELFDAHENISISFHANGLEYLEVNADRDQLTRALINLVKNGIQSIPEDQEGEIVIDLSRHEHMAVIAIRDNGEGIPAELQDKLFSPSFTTKTSGMGLGLAIVKNIVENFSGHVSFETREGIGSTFSIEIPVWEG